MNSVIKASTKLILDKYSYYRFRKEITTSKDFEFNDFKLNLHNYLGSQKQKRKIQHESVPHYF